ncbi:unnamed protein product [Psylliodes chrysocephalus]|uniref:Mutator-like transposase domain-containing protein n=1 Tax=Psylliodes chrysocephalus TaxID=3402493 RepID=A0A9P0CT21_9CUCU|nr:unnamed protein product [Psylliodes chrysocephala]
MDLVICKNDVLIWISPCMNQSNFFKKQDKLLYIEQIAFKNMKDAPNEETDIAKKQGSIGLDGVPEITVICDGTWSKRSYKRNYNALSGAAVIIGKNTGKSSHLGTDNDTGDEDGYGLEDFEDLLESEGLLNLTMKKCHQRDKY